MKQKRKTRSRRERERERGRERERERKEATNKINPIFNGSAVTILSREILCG